MSREIDRPEWQELATQLEGTHGLPSGLLRSIALNETAGGDPKFINQSSTAGAKGMFQFMDATAKEYGVDVKDPVSSTKGAASYLGGLMKKYGDPFLAAAAYNWGSGNVDRARKRARAAGLGDDAATLVAHGRMPVETQDYIKKMKGFQANTSVVDVSPQADAAAGVDVWNSLPNRADPVDAPKVADMTGLEKAATVQLAMAQGRAGAQSGIENPGAALSWYETADRYTPQGPKPIDVYGLARREFQSAATAQKKIDDTSVVDIYSAAAMDNTMWTMIREMSKPEYAPDGTSPSDAELVGLTEEQVTEMQGAASYAERERLKFDYKEYADRQQTMAAGSGFTQLAAGLLAGLGDAPAMLAGIGLSSALNVARVGSTALALAGRPGAAIASSIGENVVGGLGTEYLRQKVGGFGDEVDYYTAAAFGVVPAAISSVGLGFKAADNALQMRQAKAAQQSAAQELSYVQRAEQNVGPGADVAALEQEMDRLKTEDRMTPVMDSQNPVNESRRLWSEDDPDAVAQDLSVREEERIKAEEAKLAVPDVKELTPEEAAAVLRQSKQVDEATLESASEQVIPVSYYKAVARNPNEGSEVRSARGELNRLIGSNDPWVSRLAGQMLTKEFSDLKVVTVSAEEIAKIKGGRTTSFFDLKRNTVYMWEEHAKAPSKDQFLLHEIAHAVTAYKVDYARKKPDSAIGKIARELDVMRDLAKDIYNEKIASGELKKVETIDYYLANVDEFIAGLYSGRMAKDFTDLLASIKFDNEPSMLSRMIELARNLLGLGHSDMNALVKSLGLADNLMDQKLRTIGSEYTGTGSVGRFETLQAPSGQLLQRNVLTSDDVANRTGIALMPMTTIKQQSEATQILKLHKRAIEWAKKNPIDPAKIKTISDMVGANSISSMVDSTSLTMLKSANPLVRMLATELVEDASGAAGIRQSTASIAKHINERLIMSNAINDLEGIYTIYRKENKGSYWEDLNRGQGRTNFNQAVAQEIERRRTGTGPIANPTVVRAADVVQAGYERSRNLQQRMKTPGYAALGESSVGYMPHKMNHTVVRKMTSGQQQMLHSVLVDQFVSISGWDISFSAELASKYIERMRTRASGGFESTVNVGQQGSEEIVEAALKQMGLTTEQLSKYMDNFRKNGPGYTKKRINLDLNRVYEVDGGTMRLLDLFETDQIQLLRVQAQRAAGEAALMRHGIPGLKGMGLLRKAMEFHEDGKATTQREFEAFDQISAELLGQPFGTAEYKWLARARELTTLTKLGGMVWNQLAEYVNGVFAVGAGRTLSAAGGIPRLVGEVRALARGEKVNNPIISSIESYGAEFGTDNYKMVFPYDDSASVAHTYGRETPALMDRLLRGGMHIQSKISFWRAMNGAQQRGMAEQIVRKAARYIRDGKEDLALKDMGFSKSMIQRLQAEFQGGAAKWQGDDLVEFNVTKIQDPILREDFIQAVHRGTSQIIQGTFTGETGKWAHDGLMKTMTQFRTFSIVSMEKQWRRQRNLGGLPRAAGIFLGSMSAVAPVYIARVYANSIGRSDQEEYMEKNLHPTMIARQAINYMAVTGLAGDFMDGIGGAIPGVGAVGGRSGSSTTVLGNLVAPSAGTVENIYDILHNIDDPRKAANLLPGSRLPGIINLINLADN
jgi:Transglycosylase SLT domain